MIERPLYLNKIMPFVDTPFVKILTGVRRCGKSTILKMIQKIKRRTPYYWWTNFELSFWFNGIWRYDIKRALSRIKNKDFKY